MSEGEPLATATLDTLPINVAVIDEDGEILFTNRAWREFAREEGGVDAPEELGTNYLAASETASGETAGAATEGVREVIAGERELFTMEYPCHSPTERRWFLMRVSPFTVDGKRRVVVAHVDITGRKEAELEVDERARQLSHLLERVNGLVREVTGAVVHARSRSEVEHRAVEAFAAADPYVFAWIGRPDLRAEVLAERARAGPGLEAAPEFEISLSGNGPAARAYRTGELQVAEEVPAWADVGDGGTRSDTTPVEAVAAVPLTYRSKSYGVICVCADRKDAFDERERAVLQALGEVVATAIHAVTTQDVLRTEGHVEMDVSIQDEMTLLTGLLADTDATFEHHETLLAEDGSIQLYADVIGLPSSTVRERADEREGIRAVDVLAEHDDGTLVELSVGDSLVAVVADFDGITTELTADAERVRATFVFPDETAARAAFEHFEKRYRTVELFGYRERDRSADTVGGYRNAIEEDLTDRQLTALRLAYLGGYYGWPRETSGDELADAMDITRATFHQHLRNAHRKLAAAFFDLKSR